MEQQQQRSWGSILTAAAATYRKWWHKTVVPALLGDEDQVKQLAASKGSRWTCTQGCVRGVRPYLVVLVFVIMAVWLPVDIWRWDGIVPGTKETYMIEAKRVDDSEAAIMDWFTNFTTGSEPGVYSCPCAQDNSGTVILTRPHARLLTDKAPNTTSFTEKVWKFVTPCNGTMFDLTTEGGRKAADEAANFLWAAAGIQIRPEPGSLLLTRQAWQASRVVEFRKQLNMMADQGVMRLQKELGLPTFERFDFTEGNVSAQEEPLIQLGTFMDGFDMFATALLLNTGANTSAYHNKESLMKRMFPSCQLPMNMSPADWPLKLLELDGLDDVKKVEPNLPVPSDPFERAYYAYTTWCKPAICSKVTKKTGYVRTMQGMAVFGGMWGIITLAILVLWQCLFLGCVVGHQQQKAGTASDILKSLPSSADLGKDCGDGGSAATSADVCVSIEPAAQSMDRDRALDKV